MNNRLHEDEKALLDAARRWWGYRTPENLLRLKTATKEHVRAEHEREDA